MGVFEMVAIIVVAGIVYDMYKLKVKSDKQGTNSSEVDQRIAALTERVETLEKIVTDSSYQVKSEINRL